MEAPNAPEPALNAQRYHTCVMGIDAPVNGASTQYCVVRTKEDGLTPDEVSPSLAVVNFQVGDPRLGVNGCSPADLIGIVQHRLTGLQQGSEKSRDAERAIQSLDSALYWLTRPADSEGFPAAVV